MPTGNNARIPVTALEQGMAQVKVTAEFPHKNQRGWVKVEFHVPQGQEPKIGDVVQVHISYGD